MIASCLHIIIIYIISIFLFSINKTMEISDSIFQKPAQERIVKNPINPLTIIGMKKLVSSEWYIEKSSILTGELYEEAEDNSKVKIANRFGTVPLQIARYLICNSEIEKYINTRLSNVSQQFKRSFFSKKFQAGYLSDDSLKIAITRMYQKTQIWSVQTGKFILELEGYNYCAFSCFWAKQDRRIITADVSGIRLSNVLTGKQLQALSMSATKRLIFNRKKSIVGLVSSQTCPEKKISFFDLNNGNLLSSIKLPTDSMIHSIVNKDLDIIMIKCHDGKFMVYDFNAERLEPVFLDFLVFINYHDPTCFIGNKLIIVNKKKSTLTIYSLRYHEIEKIINFEDPIVINYFHYDKQIIDIVINPIQNNLILIMYDHSPLITVFDTNTKKIVQDIFFHAHEKINDIFRIQEIYWLADGKSFFVNYIIFNLRIITFCNVLCRLYCPEPIVCTVGPSEKYTSSGSKLVMAQLDNIIIFETDILDNYLLNTLTLEQAFLLVAIEKTHLMNNLYQLDAPSKRIFDTFNPKIQKILQKLVVKNKKNWLLNNVLKLMQ